MIVGLEDQKSTKLQRHRLRESMTKLQMVELLNDLNDFTLLTRFLESQRRRLETGSLRGQFAKMDVKKF